MKLIQDDEQYERARVALLNMAAKLDDPLSGMSEDERARQNLIYDRTAEAVREYRRSEMAVKFPGLRDIYQQLGHSFRDFSERQQTAPVPVSESPKTEAAITPPEPERPPEKPTTQPAAKPKASLSSWLDD